MLNNKVCQKCFQPFVDACLENENKFEAAKYMPKVRDELKVKYYCKLG